ncbi:MAG TPA: transposase [Candidatus Acidoferrum sp.]|nr:transposase [Candidatus Acidoferrum sp.]
MGDEIPFKAYEQQQGQLLPSFVGEALDPADPVFFVDELVEGLDLGAFERRYDGMGEHAYPPRMLLKLWLFGAIAGVYSGREIARRLWWDLRFRYLAGELRADFRTINRFRERHREDFAGVLRQTLRIARASGLAKLGRVAIDGSKIRANTSRHKAMSHKRMLEAEAQLEDEIAQILMQMDELNVREEEEHSDGDGGGGLPAELQRREQRREKIRAARQQLEREKGEKLEDRHQKSFADLEANMMKTGEGAMQYCYNAQAATSEDGIVVASAVSTSPSDAPQLVPMIDAVRENTGQRPELALADAGYRSEQNLSALRRRRQRCLVAIGRAGKSARWPTGRCTQRMHRLFRLPWARALYAHRKTQAERPFAEIKQRMRFRRFALRGQAKVRGEWDLVCAALNVVTIWRAQEA